MVLEIDNIGQFEREIQGPGLVVVDFFTTWCGPCKQIGPFIEQLAQRYPEVKFIKVDIEKNEDIARPRNIQSIPTFHFYVKGQLKDEMKGANPSTLEQKVNALKVDVNPFGGQGFKLASSANTENPPGNARDARLRAFGNLEGPHAKPAPKVATPTAEDDEDAALAKALALSIADVANTNSKPSAAAPAVTSAEDLAEIAAMEAEQDALDEQALQQTAIANAGGGGANNNEWEEEMVPVPVNEQLLAELMEMGFPDVRARKSIVHGINMDGALAWLGEHQDDADIDQPYMVRKSDTIPKPPLTAEEKAAKLQAMKDLIKKRKEDRAKEARVEEIKREKERRERGQKIDETLEERQRLARKREAEKMKKEKDDQAKERNRLRAELARDKEIRRLNKGVLPSVLGVDGYNPSIIQYDKPDSDAAAAPVPPAAAAGGDAASIPAKRPVSSVSTPSPPPPSSSSSTKSSSTTTAKKPSASAAAAPAVEVDPVQRIDSAIQTLMRYRTGGDGGAALKLLLTFVKNIVEHPEDPKYRSINTESAAYKSKLQPLVGPATLLKAVGFEKNEEDGKLKFEGDAGAFSLIATTAVKLTQAEALYRQQNP